MGIHECGLVLRTVESPAITTGQAVVGNRRRPQGTGAWSRDPGPAFSPPSASVCPVGDPGWSLPLSLRFSSVFHSACVVCLGFLLLYVPFCSSRPRLSALPHAFCFLELPHPHPMSFLMHFAFLSRRPHLSQPLFPLLHLPILSCCKREKRGRD